MYASKSAPEGSWGAVMVRVFESADRAQEAIDKLVSGGFDTSRLSIIGKEDPSDAHQLGVAAAGVHAKAWGRRSALWNRLAEDPAAMALAWVPFIGHVVAVGPVACVLVGNQWEAQANPRTSVLARMLTLAGLSTGEVRTYEAAVRGGQILLLVHGAAKHAIRARRLLNGAVSLSDILRAEKEPA